MSLSEQPEMGYRERQARAQSAVTYRLRTGQMTRAAVCERCGGECLTHGHHPDYDKPLDVEWLCRKCHAAAHKADARWVTEARGFRDDGMPFREIAKLLGVSYARCYKALNPARASDYGLRANRQRRAKGRGNDKRLRGKCRSCGGSMGIGVLRDGECQACRSVGARHRAEWLAMRRSGLTNAEIAQQAGVLIKTVVNSLQRSRCVADGLEWCRAPYPKRTRPGIRSSIPS